MRIRFSVAIIVFVILIPVGLITLYEKSEIRVPQVPLAEPSEPWLEALGFLPIVGGRQAGQGSAVDIDSNGNIYFLHRAGYAFGNATTIESDVVWIFSAETKEFVSSWGANTFKSPHGITLDANNNVWITDIMLNKVYQFDQDGLLLSTFGMDYPFYMENCIKVRNIFRKLPCTVNNYYFARPTDVEIFKDGSFVVADGYRNSRLVKFDSTGRFLWEVDSYGSGNAQFNLPHGLAIDSNENIYVADRRNARIQVFSKEGVWLENFDSPELGRPYGLDIMDDILYVVDAGDADEFSGGINRSQIIKLSLQGEIISRYRGFGNELGEMNLPHDIAVNAQQEIIVAEVNNKRLQIFLQK